MTLAPSEPTSTDAEPAPTKPRAKARAAIVDVVRGIAVLSMIGWHTADSWLDRPLRESDAFQWVIIAGGLAAPLFFLLAGVSASLAEPTVHTRRTLGRAMRRAGQIVIAGYALKLFAFAIDRGGILDAHAPAVVLGALGLTLGYVALGDLAFLDERWRAPRTHALLGMLSLCLCTLELRLLASDERAFDIVVRLDVLQGIGAALLVTTPVLAATRSVGGGRGLGPALALFALGLVVAFATPPIAALDLHPTTWARPLDYLARLTPYPAPTGARFPLLPWLSLTLVGAAIGRAMRDRAPTHEFGLPQPLRPGPTLGLAMLATYLSFEAGDAAQFFITRSEIFRNVVRLSFNTSAAIAFAGMVALAPATSTRGLRFLALLGRHSLVVYAVHLEIVYGLVSVPILHSLSWPTWALGAALLTLAMALLARAIEKRGEKREVSRAR